MAQLPFLVEHGVTVGQLLVVVGGALGVSGGWLVRRLRERRRLARERALLGREVGTLSPGLATISGTLRGRAATAVAQSGKSVRARGDKLVLEVGDVLVELRGEVEVQSGRRTASSWRKLPRGFVDGGAGAAGADAALGAWRAYELCDGDEVIARGMLANEAGMPRERDDDPTEVPSVRDAYREPAGVWVLSPVAEVPVVRLWASQPKVRPEPYHPRRLALLWFVWAAVTYSAMWVAGYQLVRHHRLELAAAMLHSRDAALAELAHDYENSAPSTDATFQLRDQLAELRGDCRDRAALELREQRYESALATARRCWIPETERDALVHLGRYPEAAMLPGTPHRPDSFKWSASPDMLIAIANGRWADAAALADDEARRFAQLHYYCIAAWFRFKSGDLTADQTTHALGVSGAVCGIAHAMMQPPAERGPLFAAALFPDPGEVPVERLASDLTWVYGAGTRPGAPDLSGATAMVTGTGFPHDSRAWLAPLAIDHATADPGERAMRYGELAALDVIRGGLPMARSHVPSAGGALGEQSSVEIEGLRQAIALHAPDPIATEPDIHVANPSTAPLVELRAGRTPQDLELWTFDRAGELVKIRVSLADDAAPLAHALATRHPIWKYDAGAVLALAPRLHEHREQLVEALRNFRSDFGSDVKYMPFGFLEEAAMHRDLAALAGDTRSAERWQKLIDAQLPLLDDPDKVIALLLWQAAHSH